MHGIFDTLLVGLAVLASVLYAVFSLGPRTLKPRLLGGIAAALRALPEFLQLHAVARRLETAAAIKPTGSCGGCDNCGSETSSATTSPAAPGPEIRIPVAKIGRR